MPNEFGHMQLERMRGEGRQFVWGGESGTVRDGKTERFNVAVSLVI